MMGNKAADDTIFVIHTAHETIKASEMISPILNAAQNTMSTSEMT